MKRALLVLLGAAVLAGYGWYDAYLFTDRLGDVQGNLEAAVIWATPAFALAVWRFERRHRQRMRRLDALHAKVDALHEHLGVPITD